MPGEPHLRPVPPDSMPDAEGALPAADRPVRGQGRSRLMLALVAALAVALALLGWSRAQLSGRVGLLEEQVRGLEVQVVERDRVIDAQRGRLQDVRTRVDGLRDLLDRPLPEAD
jgi:hypothetical protein